MIIFIYHLDILGSYSKLIITISHSKNALIDDESSAWIDGNSNAITCAHDICIKKSQKQHFEFLKIIDC